MTLDTSSPSSQGIRLRPGTFEDCQSLAPRLRPDDVQEVWSLLRQTPLEALESSFGLSDQAVVMTLQGVPILMAGVAPVPSDQERGVIWLLGTPEIKSVSRRFLIESRAYLAMFHSHYRCLWNLVDARNTVHLRWLHWLGFVWGNFHPEAGHDKTPFIEAFHYAPAQAPEAGPSQVD